MPRCVRDESWGEFAAREGESVIVWAGRALSLLRSEIDTLCASPDIHVNQLRLLIQPFFLELVYSVLYACRLDEAADRVEVERRRHRELTLLGIVIELSSGPPRIVVRPAQLMEEPPPARKGTRPIGRFGGS
jgi:hypothetical protein